MIKVRSITMLSVKRIRRKFVDVAQLDDATAQITLTNCENGNAINVQLLEELGFVMASLTERWATRCVLLKSEVPQIFSQGNRHSAVPY